MQIVPAGGAADADHCGKAAGCGRSERGTGTGAAGAGKKIGDQGRALFILAEVAVANKNRDGAEDNFQKAIAASKDPKVVGWSHVYLGRILDMKEDREAALQEYRAALNAGGELPEVKAAAERGLQRAYEPPAKPQPQRDSSGFGSDEAILQRGYGDSRSIRGS